MYLVISVPTSELNEDTKKNETQVIQTLGQRGFEAVGLATGSLNFRDWEFEGKQHLEDDELDDLESELRQLIGESQLRVYVESE